MVIFFFSEVFLFLLVEHQVKSNLHNLVCLYIKNTYTTCSYFYTCGAVNLDCSSEKRKICFACLPNLPSKKMPLCILIYCFLFKEHSEGLQCKLWGMEILFHSLSYRRWTMKGKDPAGWIHSTGNIRKKTVGSGGGRWTGREIMSANSSFFIFILSTLSTIIWILPLFLSLNMLFGVTQSQWPYRSVQAQQRHQFVLRNRRICSQCCIPKGLLLPMQLKWELKSLCFHPNKMILSLFVWV